MLAGKHLKASCLNLMPSEFQSVVKVRMTIPFPGVGVLHTAQSVDDHSSGSIHKATNPGNKVQRMALPLLPTCGAPTP